MEHFRRIRVRTSDLVFPYAIWPFLRNCDVDVSRPGRDCQSHDQRTGRADNARRPEELEDFLFIKG
jgi:hypothetical protein